MNITGAGSRITYYNLNSEDADRVFDLPGGLILDMYYLTNGDLLAVSTEALFVINKKNESKELYNFEGRRLGNYISGGRFFVLYLLDYGVGHHGKLVVLEENSGLLGEIETDREIVSISSGDDFLAVLGYDRLVFYSTSLEELPVSGESVTAVGAAKVLALSGRAALVAGDHSAVVVRIGD